jgi:tetratricopeptide (TPR) repeat protein
MQAQEFDDALTLRTEPDLVFGLLWPTKIGVLEMRARRRLLPVVATPVEEADQLAAQGDFAAALVRYQSAAPVLPTGRTELLYKQGVCQAALRRESAAVQLLEEAIAANDGLWSIRAACELWQLNIIKGDMESAQQVLDQVRGLDFHSAASLVPEPVRDRILRAYRGSSGGIVNLLQHDPERVEKAKLVVEVETRLSNSGKPSHDALMRLFEAYDYSGQHSLARATMERLLAGEMDGLESYYAHFYVRHFRLNGDLDRAAAEVERFLSQADDPKFLQLGQVHIHAARHEWRLAHDELAALLEGKSMADLQGFVPAQAMLAMGFLKQRLGEPEEGLRTWRTAAAELRNVYQQTSLISGGEVIDFLALAALADDLRPEDVELLLAPMEDTPGLASLVVQAVPRPTIHNAMRAAWTSLRGREMAEQHAFDQVSRADKVRGCFQLVGAAYCQLGAFEKPVSPEQEELVWSLTGALRDQTLESGSLDTATAGALLIVWKGTGLNLWRGVAPSLSPSLRGPLAYVFAMRFKTEGKRPAADALLRQAQEDAEAEQDERLQSLVQEALASGA